MVNQKAIAAAIGDVIAQRDALAAELDSVRHEYKPMKLFITKNNSTIGEGEEFELCGHPPWCMLSADNPKHRTSAVVLAEVQT